jgi:hypothetical protein
MAYNATALLGTDLLRPPPAGLPNQPVPPELPTTLADLRNLQAPELDVALAYYGLQATGTFEDQRERVKRAYGVIATL